MRHPLVFRFTHPSSHLVTRHKVRVDVEVAIGGWRHEVRGRVRARPVRAARSVVRTPVLLEDGVCGRAALVAAPIHGCEVALEIEGAGGGCHGLRGIDGCVVGIALAERRVDSGGGGEGVLLSRQVRVGNGRQGRHRG